MRGRVNDSPLSGTRPIFTNAVVNDALSATMRKSHAQAIAKPAPAAMPLTAAMTILAELMIAVMNGA